MGTSTPEQSTKKDHCNNNGFASGTRPNCTCNCQIGYYCAHGVKI